MKDPLLVAAHGDHGRGVAPDPGVDRGDHLRARWDLELAVAGVPGIGGDEGVVGGEVLVCVKAPEGRLVEHPAVLGEDLGGDRLARVGGLDHLHVVYV